MKNLSRKESQVSKDFAATLKTVVRLSTRTASDIARSRQLIQNTSSFNETRGSRTKPLHSDYSKHAPKSLPMKMIAPVNQNDKKRKSLGSIQTDTIKGNLELHTISTSPKKLFPSENSLSQDWESADIILKVDPGEASDIKSSKEEFHYESYDDNVAKVQGFKETENNFVSKNISNNLQDKNNKKSFLEKLMRLENDVPFEGTDIANLPFNLPIIIENEEKLLVKVYGHFTVLKLKNKISKKKSLSAKEMALIYKNTRLENHITLSWYNINSKSHVSMKILKQVELLGRFLKRNYSILIYTSEKINEIRDLFAKEINISSEHIELKYKEIFLSSNKEFFLYGISPGSTIDIMKRKMSLTEESPDRMQYEKSPGFEISQHFQTMTSKLKKCNCESRRLHAMSCGILATFDPNFERHKCLKLLSEFTNLHHKSCPESRNSPISKREIEDEGESVTSVGEISLQDGIQSEIQKIRENKQMIIEKTDMEYLCYTKNFKAFKHFLRERIGTKCNLGAVAMLYHYAQSIVVYLNDKDEDRINKMLSYIKLYFRKYFEKSIIAKGGLAELTLSRSDDVE